MRAVVSLLLLLLPLLAGPGPGAAEVLYVLGDAVLSTSNVGYSGASGAAAACANASVSQHMVKYLSTPASEVVPVTISSCGAYLASDVLAGLDWIDGDINFSVRNVLALAVDVADAGTATDFVAAHLAGYKERHVLVATAEGFSVPAGVLVVPRPGPAPVPAAVQRPAPAAPRAPSAPPDPDRGARTAEECEPWWRRVVIIESVVLALGALALCGLAGFATRGRKPRRDTPPLDMRASRSQLSQYAGVQPFPEHDTRSHDTRVPMYPQQPRAEAFLDQGVAGSSVFHMPEQHSAPPPSPRLYVRVPQSPRHEQPSYGASSPRSRPEQPSYGALSPRSRPEPPSNGESSPRSRPEPPSPRSSQHYKSVSSHQDDAAPPPPESPPTRASLSFKQPPMRASATAPVPRSHDGNW